MVEMKALLFELDGDTRWVIQQMLELSDLEVTAVSDPAEALTAVSRTRFHVVLLDRAPSAFNGAPSLSWMVRTMQPGTPIILTASWKYDPAEILPCDAILEKPFSLERLQVTIHTVTAHPSNRAPNVRERGEAE